MAHITKQNVLRCDLESEDKCSGQLIPVWMLDEVKAKTRETAKRRLTIHACLPIPISSFARGQLERTRTKTMRFGPWLLVQTEL